MNELDDYEPLDMEEFRAQARYITELNLFDRLCAPEWTWMLRGLHEANYLD